MIRGVSPLEGGNIEQLLNKSTDEHKFHKSTHKKRNNLQINRNQTQFQLNFTKEKGKTKRGNKINTYIDHTYK